ncbi:Mog1p PsbP-like protein [Coniophora puteana RWD-64-598 SS2]|uniref:Mog1p PsbP-like protein n=1 Tax=Coniophora puteana (strain RWD-64-598) TaxID=741705 RepID=A0A5M3N1R0_CONPW|nr:Mog1p PsbP-like protein [Coniophora puteana RWD-64-598 SS2]EIW85246.1 Mog1p PsbP-like protein [Coniophora puteana RWD-64-598 SS2]
MSSIRELFGGAIQCTLPTRLVDVSKLRQVPDSQEVFVYPDSDASFIIEVLEHAPPTDVTEAIKYHFTDIAQANGDDKPRVLDTRLIVNDRMDDTPSPVVLRGKQSAVKFNQPQPTEVTIFMGLFRVQGKNVDLLVTANVPEGDIEPDFDIMIRSLRIMDYGLFA